MKMKKVADLLIEKKIAFDKKEAESLIMAGKIYINDEPIKKPGQLLPDSSDIKVKNIKEYVSRGAIKLKKAVDDFGILLIGKIAIDIGASTGGFTDFMLRNKIKKVIAVDVNYGQFDWQLRNNPDVVLFERTNIKKLLKKDLPEIPNLAVADLSFISLKNVFGNIFDIISDEGEILLLVKPQFEAKREMFGKKGIILDKEAHEIILKELTKYIIDNFPIEFKGISFSPIKGAKGNIEFWLYVKKIVKNNSQKKDFNYDRIFQMIETIVNQAHEYFLRRI